MCVIPPIIKGIDKQSAGELECARATTRLFKIEKVIDVILRWREKNILVAEVSVQERIKRKIGLLCRECILCYEFLFLLDHLPNQSMDRLGCINLLKLHIKFHHLKEKPFLVPQKQRLNRLLHTLADMMHLPKLTRECFASDVRERLNADSFAIDIREQAVPITVEKKCTATETISHGRKNRNAIVRK